MRKILPKLAMVMVAVGLFAAFKYYGLGTYLSFDYLKQQQGAFQALYEQNRVTTLAAFIGIYIASAALSLPGATVLTLAGGALFGLWTGLIAVSFASTIGATLAMIVARFLLRDSLEKKFGERLKTINDGIQREGAFYLFAMRLVPIFPFFVINIVMGLTRFPIIKFFWVSQIGMLAGTVVYVNAGTQIAQLDSLAGIMSPKILASFALLGVFPFIATRILDALKTKRIMSRWKKPKTFDYNVVVIGAGSGGLVSSYIAAAVKAKVALIEKKDMGGDCLNTGCVPSKALIRSAKVLNLGRRAKEFGLRKVTFEFDFSEIMDRVHRVIKSVAPHDSVERYTELGVDCIQGTAKIISPYEVEVNNQRLTTKNIIVATGGGPIVPALEGLEKIDYLTSDTVWNLRDLPKRLVVLGAGPIGCELAQCFARFGSSVTLVDRNDTILCREDNEVSSLMMETFKSEGIKIVTGATAKRFETSGQTKSLILETSSGEQSIEFDQVLFAMGRKAHAKGCGLEELGVRISDRGTIEHDEFMRTNIPNIFCVGDVAGPYQFTHVAAHQAWYASVNALFGGIKSFKADYRVIPRVTFTDPEIATVGLSEKEAIEKGVPYEVTTYGLDDLDRAIADEEAHGFVKVLTVPGKDTILGATVMGDHAGDYFVEFVSAMQNKFGMNKILGTVHAYPTLAEANKYAAGNWKKAHAPEALLKKVAKFHQWRRGGSTSPKKVSAATNNDKSDKKAA